MNSISWFLYLAEVVGNISVLLSFSMFTFGIALVVLSIIYWANVVIYREGSWLRPDPYDIVKAKEKYKVLLKPIYIVSIIFCISCSTIFIPSQNTIYMIAASQTSEVIIKTPEAQQLMDKITKTLNIKLDEILKTSGN